MEVYPLSTISRRLYVEQVLSSSDFVLSLTENSGAEGVRFLGSFPSIISLPNCVSWFLLSLQTTSLSRMGEPETKTLL